MLEPMCIGTLDSSVIALPAQVRTASQVGQSSSSWLGDPVHQEEAKEEETKKEDGTEIKEEDQKQEVQQDDASLDPVMSLN